MIKDTAVYQRHPQTRQGQNRQSGLLLINQEDEILYANRQARHFLGLFSDDDLPRKLKFMALAQSAYQCYPTAAWLNWPTRPSSATTRRLVYTPSHRSDHLQLKVEILEQIVLDGSPVWAVALIAEELRETAVFAHTTG
jgi:PAS domain-containing protein